MRIPASAQIELQDCRLTPRQIELLTLIGQDFTDTEISEKMGLKKTTIAQMALTIRNKIGVSNRVAMAVYAVRAGLIEKEV